MLHGKGMPYIESAVPYLIGTGLIAQAVNCQLGIPKKEKMQTMGTRHVLMCLLPEVDKYTMAKIYIDIYKLT